jgi:DNA-directed RNA polymerase specialized sigma24 family protein
MKKTRSITIETNRTVMVRKTAVRTEEWGLSDNTASRQTRGATDSRPSASGDFSITELELDRQNFPWANNDNVSADTERLASLTGEEDAFKPFATEYVAESKQKAPIKSNLDDLLDWLGEDREMAGIRYEEIRRALIKIFVCRGAHISEDLADETIDRVARKLPEIRDNYHGRPIDYFCGVAKMIYLEYHRRSIPQVVTVPAPVEVDEEMYIRLDRCLEKLTTTDRSLILEYYGGEKQQKIVGRKQLADKLGIPLNALRIRAHRIRTHLMGMMMS